MTILRALVVFLIFVPQALAAQGAEDPAIIRADIVDEHSMGRTIHVFLNQPLSKERILAYCEAARTKFALPETPFLQNHLFFTKGTQPFEGEAWADCTQSSSYPETHVQMWAELGVSKAKRKIYERWLYAMPFVVPTISESDFHRAFVDKMRAATGKSVYLEGVPQSVDTMTVRGQERRVVTVLSDTMLLKCTFQDPRDPLVAKVGKGIKSAMVCMGVADFSKNLHFEDCFSEEWLKGANIFPYLNDTP